MPVTEGSEALIGQSVVESPGAVMGDVRLLRHPISRLDEAAAGPREIKMADPTNKIYYCPIELVLDLIADKWKPMILSHLRYERLEFGELSARIPLATRRMLTRQLRELERDGLVERAEGIVVPPPIEYALTAVGRRLGPILDRLRELGEEIAHEGSLMVQPLWEMEEKSVGERRRAS